MLKPRCKPWPLEPNQTASGKLGAVHVAYNGRRQRVLKGRSPDMVLRERLKAKPELAKPVTKPPDPDALPKALKVAADAKEVSHPDKARPAKRCSRRGAARHPPRFPPACPEQPPAAGAVPLPRAQGRGDRHRIRASLPAQRRPLRGENRDADGAQRPSKHDEEGRGGHSAPGPLTAPAAAALKAAAKTATRAALIIAGVSRPRVPRIDRRCIPSRLGPRARGTLP